MSRISYRRASPENWERTIKRMVTLDHVNLDPADARNILKYLSDHNGLAPEEARPIAGEAEHRPGDRIDYPDKDTSDTCSSCHAITRPMSERRTKEEWELLVGMHRYYYPLIDVQPMNGGQGFRRTRPLPTDPAPDGRPPDNRHPMEKALAQLTKAYPLITPEWARWSASLQPPQLAGRWAVSGYQLGVGRIFGEVTIAGDPGSPDGFTTRTRYTVARTGETVARTGKGIVYTGFQWRGRGTLPGVDQPWREVLFVERNSKEMSGRWFTGAYDETGIDVTLARIDRDPIVSGSSVTALKTGTRGQRVRIFGANLPGELKPEDIAFGQGVKAVRVVNSLPDEIVVDVDVAGDAPIGPRDLSVARAFRPAALIIYDKIDRVEIRPQAGMARVGGAVFPKQLQQFEAVGVNDGPDGKPGTADDLDLGPIDVKWSLEEYPASYDDDDIQYVGTLGVSGLFTPALDGPNPKRSGNRNNVGDVWVVAEVPANDSAGVARTLRARAFLLVTVPVYAGWYESEGMK
jgi:quinohemoprotein amine dehydrogenase